MWSMSRADSKGNWAICQDLPTEVKLEVGKPLPWLGCCSLGMSWHDKWGFACTNCIPTSKCCQLTVSERPRSLMRPVLNAFCLCLLRGRSWDQCFLGHILLFGRHCSNIVSAKAMRRMCSSNCSKVHILGDLRDICIWKDQDWPLQTFR